MLTSLWPLSYLKQKSIGSFVFDGTNDYIELPSAPVTAAPATISVWFNANDTLTQALVSIGDSSATSRLQADKRTGAAIGAVAVNSAGTSSVSTKTSYVTGAWHHVASVFASTTSRTAYLDGAAGTTDTTSISVSGLNSVLLGARYSSGTRGAFLFGRVAQVAIWNVALSGAEVTALAAGANPMSIQPSSLAFYAPLNDGSARDIVSGTALTVSGPLASKLGPEVV